MKTKMCYAALLMVSPFINANDTAGYVATSGVQYIKNNDIQMYSEDLKISKNMIKVDYQFKNLSDRDITEAILFPLPKVENYTGMEYADTEALLKSFQIKVDGQKIQPTMHVRAYLQYGNIDVEALKQVDITAEFKKCGFSQQDLLNPWTRKIHDPDYYYEKVKKCNNPKINQYFYDGQEYLSWSSEVIYSWQQTFKANTMTRVQHQYRPLVGGSVSLYMENDAKEFCMDQAFKNALKKRKADMTPYSALGYILTTGANWAKPIADFKVTIERDKDELVSFCWDGQVKKISPTQFQIVERNFTPKQDLEIIFVEPRTLDY